MIVPFDCERHETTREEQWTPRISVSSFTKTEFRSPVGTRKPGNLDVSIILEITEVEVKSYVFYSSIQGNK